MQHLDKHLKADGQLFKHLKAGGHLDRLVVAGQWQVLPVLAPRGLSPNLCEKLVDVALGLRNGPPEISDISH